MNFIEFVIGVLIANALAHFIIGMTKTRFLGMFGYSPQGNIAYAIVQFIAAMILIFVQYTWEAILSNGILTGALSVLIIYLLMGHFFVKLFKKQ